jgi:ABC-type sugar transport system ATPase subunit
VSGAAFAGVVKRYGDAVALEGLDLVVEPGELLVMVGPSGSGKSTALRALAGLTDVDAGTITVGGRDVTRLPPHKRDVAMVFQDYALYPHLTVAENVAFGLRARKVPAAVAAGKAAEVAEQLGIGDLGERYPDQLSGGQQQRVALARCMVREPVLQLMDEPLSNLDAQLRLSTRADIVALQRRLGTTTVYVTHDQAEAMTMGDRVAVLADGRLQQVGTPEEVYDRPANRFVAGFLGSPPMNLVAGRS